MSKSDRDEDKRRIGELEDELKSAKARIEELRLERDEQNELIKRQDETIQQCGEQIDQWIAAFEMVQNEKGNWCWADGLAQDRDRWFHKFVELRAKWNKFVGHYNAAVSPRNMGRPLAASEAQRAGVLKRRKAGQSLREIAEDMSLSLQTVRTIVGKKNGTDRATLKRLERIAPDKLIEARARRAIKDIKALPATINANLKSAAELRKEAKGLR
jgi:hypothetical protein